MTFTLPSQCVHIAGELGKGFGYSIQHRNGVVYSRRNTTGYVPHYGHYRFIVACAELCQLKLHLKDLSVTRDELMEAAVEASCELREHPYTLIYFHIRQDTKKQVYNAQDVLFLHKLYAV